MSGAIFLDLTAGWQRRPLRRRKRMPDGSVQSGTTLYDRKRVRKIDRVLLHQWGVNPGLAPWNDATRKLLFPFGAPEIADSFELIYRLAARALRVPYHLSAGVVDVGGASVPIVVQAWPFTLHTHHAGLQNEVSIGVGIMGSFARLREKRSMSEALIVASRDAVRRAAVGVKMARRSSTHAAPLLHTHSQSTAKPADPGEEVIAEIVAPLVRAGTIDVEPGWSSGSGRPWPEEWRHWLA